MNKKVLIGAALFFTIAVYGAYTDTRTNTAQLTTAEESTVVELKNGDSYDLVMDEVQKTIAGRAHTMLAYNGSIPGPLIKVPQGAEITINFTNATDIKTLLHSHGVRMDNAFDGSQVTQKEMEPGESFTYKLKFPDAGAYWYHPHVHDAYAQEMGLYGNFIVIPADESYWTPVNREVALFLDDILIEGGKLNLSKTGTDHVLMGRFGNVMLVNGQENFVLRAKKGEVVRLYLTNAANTRPFNFAIKGTRMKLVGGDNGAYEKAQWVDSVLLGPSERAIVDVLIQSPTTIVNDTPSGMTALGSIAIESEAALPSYAEAFADIPEHQATKASIDSFRQYFDKAPDKRLTLTIDMMGMGGMGGMNMGSMGGMMGAPAGGIEWEDSHAMMNANTTADSTKWHIVDQDTGKIDMDINWALKRDEPVKIRIFNDPKSMHPMQHPIHFHGNRFLVLERDGVKETNLVWKDTTLIKAGETVDILLDPSNLGVWMAHCHILEHIEAGMMFTYTVE